MTILVAAATIMEIRPFIHFLKNKELVLPNVTIDVTITGVGTLATTYSLCKQLSRKKYDFMYQAGVAGCFDKAIPLGKLFAIKKDVMGDEGVEEKKQLRSSFDLGLRKISQPPFKKGWLVNPFIKKSNELPLATAITVNKITTGNHNISIISHKYSPLLESMEGAAFHYVALMEKIPFLQLRSISNYIGDRNKKNWKMKEAIENVNSALIKNFIRPSQKSNL